MIVQFCLPVPPTIHTSAMPTCQQLPVFSPLHQLSCLLGKYLPHLNLVMPVNCYSPLKTLLRHDLLCDFSKHPSLSQAVLVYVYGSGVISGSILFHSQKGPGLNKELFNPLKSKCFKYKTLETEDGALHWEDSFDMLQFTGLQRVRHN